MRYLPLAVAMLSVTTLTLASPASAAPPYPVHTFVEGVVAALLDPSAPPPGVNVPCTPSAAHPRPVVLVDATFANMTDDWSYLGPTLANLGYCVYSTPLGADPHAFVQTIGPVADSLAELSSFVDSVLAETQASTVDLVGHSQGGMLAEYYTKFLGPGKVSTVVGLSPSTHGTSASGLFTLAAAFPGAIDLIGVACPACADQTPDSAVITRLNTGPIAQPGVHYTVVETHYELVVTPAGKAAFIDEPGVHNFWVQDFCALDLVEHATLSYDRTVRQLVVNALDPANATPVGC